MEGGKAQVSHSMEVFDSQTRVPKGLKEKSEILEGGVVNDFGIRRAWEVISILEFPKGKGG